MAEKQPAKTFNAKQLTAPIPTVANKEENSAKAKELLNKVKDKEKPSASEDKKPGVIGANVPASSEQGPVLPLIGPMAAPPKRKINLLDGDRHLPDNVLLQEERRKQAIESILAKKREQEIEQKELDEELKKKAQELAAIPEPPASTIPMPPTNPTSKPNKTAAGKSGKDFIGPTLPASHPLAHTQDIPLPAKKEDRFQPIGPNDPLVFKQPLPPTSSSGSTSRQDSEDGKKSFIPPEIQDERYKALQEQVKKHIRKKMKEDGVLEDSEDEEETSVGEAVAGDDALEVEEGQLQLTEEMMGAHPLITQLSPHGLPSVPLSMVQIPVSVPLLAGPAPATTPTAVMTPAGLPQAGAPMVVVSSNNAIMAAQAQAAAAVQQQQQQQAAAAAAQQQQQIALAAAAQQQAAAAAAQQQAAAVAAGAGQLIQTPQGLVRAVPSALAIAQMQQQAHLQQQAQMQQAAQLQQAHIQQAQIQQMQQAAQMQQIAAAQSLQLQPQLLAAHQSAVAPSGLVMQAGAGPMLVRLPRHPHL